MWLGDYSRARPPSARGCPICASIIYHDDFIWNVCRGDSAHDISDRFLFVQCRNNDGNKRHV